MFQRQTTFTPRMLLVDLKGSLHSLSERGDLYEPTYNSTVSKFAWEENLVDIQKQSTAAKTEFLSDLDNNLALTKIANKKYVLENEVKVWSDYLYARFHPRSVNIVKQFEHCNHQSPFEVFPLGVELWKTQQFGDDFCDNIRKYVEECDTFQVRLSLM